MKEFNPKTASLATFYHKIEQFWENKSPNKPYTLNDLTNEFNLSRKWRYDTYASEKIVPLLEKQVDKIESEIINFMMKSPDGAKLYWQRAFNYKYSLQEKQLEQELNLNNVLCKFKQQILSLVSMIMTSFKINATIFLKKIKYL